VPSVTGLAFGEAVTGAGLPATTVITNIQRVADPNNAGQFLFQVVLSNPLPAAASLTFAPTSVAGSTLNMAGGNVQTGGVDRDLSNLTVLKVSDNSTIDLGSAGNLRFADSSLAHWTNGKIVTINNPTGAHIFAGSTSSGMNPNELANVQFSGSGLGATIDGSGELHPGAPTGTIELLGNVDHNTATDRGDIGALTAALSNVNAYTNNLTLDSGWTSKASQALYLADVDYNDRINNLDLQRLIVYLANGGNGSNAPGGGSVSPVPEPSTLVLLAIGGLLFCGRQLRRLPRRRGDN
jgi:hypothetical protein